MTNAKTFTVQVSYTFNPGWGVYFTLTHDDDGNVVEVDGSIVYISSQTVEVVEFEPCVDGIRVLSFLCDPSPVSSDMHDLRSRWFATNDAAQEHLRVTMYQWNHPKMWQTFIQTDECWLGV